MSEVLALWSSRRGGGGKVLIVELLFTIVVLLVYQNVEQFFVVEMVKENCRFARSGKH